MFKHAEFYQTHLDRVSRSFAFCIAQLPDPMRSWVGLSYLLCRILDTIEDSPWPVKSKQMDVFALFDEALKDPLQVSSLKNWSELFSAQINPSERALLVDAELIFNDLHALPPNVRGQIQIMVQSMSLGMQHFASINPPGQLRLTTLSEVNQYCFFVAGLVGELLAHLLSNVEPTFRPDEDTVLRSHHFGLFLQKVNLLKDQVSDEDVGRHLIPSRDLVEKSAEANANQAFSFLAALPKAQIEFRRFCAWSLFLGLEAIAVARESLKTGTVVKVARDKATEIIGSVEAGLSDDQLLRSMFEQAMGQLGWQKPLSTGPVSGAVPEWIVRHYRGELRPQSLVALGISF